MARKHRAVPHQQQHLLEQAAQTLACSRQEAHPAGRPSKAAGLWRAEETASHPSAALA